MTPNSRRGTQYWWVCAVDATHEWQATVSDRARGHAKCPHCVPRRGTISLAEAFPEIAAQWHPTKNGQLTPKDVPRYSGAKAWWVCAEAQHEWYATISNRTTRGSGCPKCYHDHTSLSASPVMAQWHHALNTLDPNQVHVGDTRKAWWVCPVGDDHVWEASISHRTRRNVGCPFCSGARVASDNSLTALRPDLAAQWHPTKNIDLTPRDVTPGSDKVVWWLCPVASTHEWSGPVGTRGGKQGAGCPFCSGRRVSTTNALSVAYPQIAAQWHPTKNGDLTSDRVAKSSHQKVWWLCPVGHEYQTLVQSRTAKGVGCSVCSGHSVGVTTSLAARFPELAAQWHPTKNGELIPDQVTPGSGKKVWWLYTCGHEGIVVVSSHTRKNSGLVCAACYRNGAGERRWGADKDSKSDCTAEGDSNE